MSEPLVQRDLPPYVYVPCSPVHEGDIELTVDLRRTQTGRIALLVYSALDRLVDCCGPEQPWTVLPAIDLEKVREATGFELIMLDMRIPEHLRRGAEGEPP
jgi:hypothetical protein